MLLKKFTANSEQELFDLCDREFKDCRISGTGNNVLFFTQSGREVGKIILAYKEERPKPIFK
jgi:hypothetical protein